MSAERRQELEMPREGAPGTQALSEAPTDITVRICGAGTEASWSPLIGITTVVTSVARIEADAG